jgi:hypothetical protein
VDHSACSAEEDKVRGTGANGRGKEFPPVPPVFIESEGEESPEAQCAATVNAAGTPRR